MGVLLLTTGTARRQWSARIEDPEAVASTSIDKEAAVLPNSPAIPLSTVKIPLPTRSAKSDPNH